MLNADEITFLSLTNYMYIISALYTVFKQYCISCWRAQDPNRTPNSQCKICKSTLYSLPHAPVVKGCHACSTKGFAFQVLDIILFTLLKYNLYMIMWILFIPPWSAFRRLTLPRRILICLIVNIFRPPTIQCTPDFLAECLFWYVGGWHSPAGGSWWMPGRDIFFIHWTLNNIEMVLAAVYIAPPYNSDVLQQNFSFVKDLLPIPINVTGQIPPFTASPRW